MEVKPAIKTTLIAALMVLLLLAPSLFSGCDSVSPSQKGFAIYLTKSNIPPDQMEILSRVAIADTPLVSSDDVISYTWNNHEIELTAEAFKRLGELQVPTTGTSFVVCVDDSPIYWGAFWTPVSSQSFSGVVIIRLISAPVEVQRYFIIIGLGYPTQSFFRGEDPRSNPIIKEALEKSGKLK
jgi:hypothetical protein